MSNLSNHGYTCIHACMQALEDKLEKKGQAISSSIPFKFEVKEKTQPRLKLTTNKIALCHPPTAEVGLNNNCSYTSYMAIIMNVYLQ